MELTVDTHEFQQEMLRTHEALNYFRLKMALNRAGSEKPIIDLPWEDYLCPPTKAELLAEWSRKYLVYPFEMRANYGIDGVST